MQKEAAAKSQASGRPATEKDFNHNLYCRCHVISGRFWRIWIVYTWQFVGLGLWAVAFSQMFHAMFAPVSWTLLDY